MTTPQRHSLVLYKNQPALVTQSGDKIDILLRDGKSISVRPKDVMLLHPGPLNSLGDLAPQTGEVAVAWELLAGSDTTLPDLAELIYEQFTPATAWATWELIDDGLYFQGDPDAIAVRTSQEVSQIQADREAKAAQAAAWEAFLERASRKQIAPEDEIFLRDVEAVAYGLQDKSRILRELDITEEPEQAHQWLLDVGHWDETVNPYPARHGVSLSNPTGPLPPLPDEERQDLTHLPAFAIDDEGNQDPDDALSLEGDRLWVHIADVAALVPPNSPADIEARGRGANLYMPERVVPMLPPEATRQLGLGLREVSPALSFGLDIDAEGQVTHLEIKPSWVKVTRLPYQQVEAQLEQSPFSSLYEISRRLKARRQANGEIDIDLPEVKIKVVDGTVDIQPIPPLRSRNLVLEAMLAVGEAVGHLAIREGIAIPFTTQDEPNAQTDSENLDGMAAMFATRISMKRSQLSSIPGRHAGLGLDVYVKTTSPLRRYSDLVAHQQLRAFLSGAPLLDTSEVLERVGQAEAVEGDVRRTERMARRHWTLVYLRRRPDWQGTGILVDIRGPRGIVLIPELDFEVRPHLRTEVPLNSELSLTVQNVNLARLEAYVRVDEP